MLTNYERKTLSLVASLQLLLHLALASSAVSQQLSIRRYDVSNGLAHSHVAAMHQDAKGYLWVATWEGLSRFDGYRFTNYTELDGLGSPIINDITEDRTGNLWVATNGGGVARLNNDARTSQSGAREKFTNFRINESLRANRVNAFLFDSHNNIWCATDGGLFRAAVDAGGPHNFAEIVPYEGEIGMSAFADHSGRLWFGMDNQLIEVTPEEVVKYDRSDELGTRPIKSIAEDSRGRVLVANESDVFEFLPAAGTARGTWRKLPVTFGADQGVNVLLNDADGALWIGTWNGLIKYQDGKQTLYSSAQGLSDNNVSSLIEDREGDLWIGTVGGGICKLESELIVTYTQSEGLTNQDVRKVFEDGAGHIYASIENGGVVQISGGRAVPVPESQKPPFTNFNERIVRDVRGDWWIGTDAGLFRFRGPELKLMNGQRISEANGLPQAPMGGLYSDSSGRLWVSPENHGLYDLDSVTSKSGTFKQLVPPSSTTLFRGAQEAIADSSGTLWLAGHEWLGRLINNELLMLDAGTGLPETRPRTFFVDSRGWLWIGLRYKGVSVTKDPSASTPHFTNYSAANGLASDAVWAIAEDDSGRMYFGTGKGLDQLDPGSGRIRHFNTDDGLASDIVNSCFKDRTGNIWIGTTLGLSRFNPHAERNHADAAPIYLSRVQIAGEDLPLPETGEQTVPQIELSAARNNISIEFVALSFQGKDELRYQYKLDGVDKDWNPPGISRSVNYARLAPGSYQFLVRAINQDGTISPAPASFQFRILPPVWQRWWFIALAALAIGLVMYFVYRQRLARLLELERVRTRIATDLHDDIGANLSLIAMLSEVSRGELRDGDSRLREWLTTIAATSRDTVDSMSDIVWAVNPKRDHLRDLTRRMRHFADDAFAARNIRFQFDAPDLDRDIRLGADIRREVFLIFKETINNAVRHSACSEAAAKVNITGGFLIVEITDNGKGLPALSERDGTGLDSMRARAQRLGGSLHFDSAKGTRITIKIPLA